MNQLTLGQTSPDSSPDFCNGNSCANTSNVSNSKTWSEIISSQLEEGIIRLSHQRSLVEQDPFAQARRTQNRILLQRLQERKRFEYLRVLRSGLFEQDSTRNSPAPVFPVQEQDELEAEVGSLSITEPTASMLSERKKKKNKLELLRIVREKLHSLGENPNLFSLKSERSKAPLILRTGVEESNSLDKECEDEEASLEPMIELEMDRIKNAVDLRRILEKHHSLTDQSEVEKKSLKMQIVAQEMEKIKNAVELRSRLEGEGS